MKTANILLILLVSSLLASSFPQRAFCFSSGYERHTTDLFEVYTEYFPIVPVDLSNPTASEEFAIKFQIRQNDYWDSVIHYVPSAFGVHVFFWDECGSSDWPTWKRWYPTSTEQSGLIASWTLSAETGKLGISASIATAAIHHYNTNYTKYSVDYDGKTYIHIGSLEVYYDCWPWWGQVYAEGAGSLGIPNDVAINHNGHHVQIAIQFILSWTGFFTTWPVATSIGACYFIVGDDIPADTDCWITVQPGKTNFAIKYPQSSGGGGGCPYIYTWDGQQYRVDNNLLPASELSDGADVEDYYMLERPLVPIYQGRTYSLYSMQIREFEYEHDFIDKVQLLAVDHPADVKIAVTQDGEILTYKSPFPPLSCLDNNGVSRLGEISKMDGDISDPATYFEGYPGDYLVLNFGKIVSDNANLILRDDQKCAVDNCINVQVPDAGGGWRTAEVLSPRDFWSMETVNMTAYVPTDGDFVVRLLWTAPHRLDYVGLDTTPQDSVEINEAHLISAVHSTQGNVKHLLMKNDQTYAELTPGQQILLTFLLPNNRNEERTFILYTVGHYITIET